MALSKAFAVGELLTAEDVNDHIVNHVPAPGDPYITDLIKLPDPGGQGWGTHSFWIYREGVTVYFNCNTQIGSATAGSLLAVLPVGFRPPIGWETAGITNSGGGSAGYVRVSTDGEVRPFWSAGPGSSNWIRTSGSWPTGLVVAD